MKAASLLITVFAALCVTVAHVQSARSGSGGAPNAVGTERPNVITAPNAIYVEILGSGLISDH
jgi:hypothetical protein